MRYTIRHFDLPLFTFEANMDSADTGLHIIKVYKEKPFFSTFESDGISRWCRTLAAASHDPEEPCICRCAALQGGAFFESSAGNYCSQ